MHHRARAKHRPYAHGLLLVIISVAVGYATLFGNPFRSEKPAFAAPITGLTLPGVSSSIPPQDQTVLRPPAINKTKRAEQPIAQQQQEVRDQLVALSVSPTPIPPPTEEQQDAALRASTETEPVALDVPPYRVHQVEEGDTVSSIAVRFGVAVDTIIDNNIEIQDSDFLTLGQSIIVPAADGVLHEVRYGETLSDIADRYGVTVDNITGFTGNKITSADSIVETQLVLVPGGRRIIETAPVAEPLPTDPDPAAEPVDPATDDGTSEEDGGFVEDGDAIVGGGPESGEGLIWPIYGPISSPYGGGHPLGIDIDGFNLVGSPIAAATSGTVVFAGGNACCSYGLYVVVVSPGGIETLYAHLSSISVVQGETVVQGQQIGVIGNTGYSTGVHLHFEVIDNGVRVNPISYLP